MKLVVILLPFSNEAIMSIIALKTTNIILCRTNQTNQNTVLEKNSNLFWMNLSFSKVPHHLSNLCLNLNSG